MTLSEIIERVEAATGPDRELDAEIACLLVDGRVEISRHPSAKVGMVKTRYLSGSTGTWIARSYTFSVDDALTLVPEGFILDYLGDNAAGEAGNLKPFGARADVTNGPIEARVDASSALWLSAHPAIRARLAMEKSATPPTPSESA